MKPVMVLLLANMLNQRKKENEPLGLRDILLPLLYILFPAFSF